MREVVAFERIEDFDRMARAVRDTERLMRSTPFRDTPTAATSHMVVVQITGPESPFTLEGKEVGMHKGLFINRDCVYVDPATISTTTEQYPTTSTTTPPTTTCRPGSTSTTAYPYPHDGSTTTTTMDPMKMWHDGAPCRVLEINGGTLRVGCRYLGLLACVIGEYPIILVEAIGQTVSCTTTPTPDTTIQTGCKGQCKWVFDFDNCRWSLFQNCCQTNDCNCAPPIFCPADSGESCVISYTNCYKGPHREVVPCPCLTTTVAPGPTTTPDPATTCDPCKPGCTTTTIDPSSTTTTVAPSTTQAPECTGCDWEYTPGLGFYLIRNGCNPAVCSPCEMPDDSEKGSGEECVIINKPCPPFTTVPPACDERIPCRGYFDWTCTASRGWVRSGGPGCSNGICGSCFVDVPSGECPCGAKTRTFCYDSRPPCFCPCRGPCDCSLICPENPPGDDPGNTTTQAPTTRCPTTTQMPENCDGVCVFSWNGVQWNFLRSNCTGCGCPLPPRKGHTNCEQFATPCFATTTPAPTTTTTTTTTTSTTADPCAQECVFLWSPGWMRVRLCPEMNDCYCPVPYPPFEPEPELNTIATYQCGPLTTTPGPTTTGAPTTTTTTTSTTSTTPVPPTSTTTEEPVTTTPRPDTWACITSGGNGQPQIRNCLNTGEITGMTQSECLSSCVCRKWFCSNGNCIESAISCDMTYETLVECQAACGGTTTTTSTTSVPTTTPAPTTTATPSTTLGGA